MLYNDRVMEMDGKKLLWPLLHLQNQMQLEMADYALSAAAWRTRRNIPVIFDSGLFPPLYENMTSSTKPKIHNASLELSSEKDQSTVTANM